jgi:hypothetical protein
MALFQKGQSGNPSGKPKGAERRARDAISEREYVAGDGKTYLGKDIALQVLVDIATSHSEKARDRVSASKEVLDRTLGRTTQIIEHDGSLQINKPRALPRGLSLEELELLASLDEDSGDESVSDELSSE